MVVDDKFFEKLVNAFRKLPGVGRKSAERYAMHILSMGEEEVENFVDVIISTRKHFKKCSQCKNICVTDPCKICASNERDDKLLCVVEKPSGVSSIERAGVYKGKYYVLDGLLSPIDGIGPEELGISRLLEIVKIRCVDEVIVATGATTEGEATATYISQILSQLGVKVTRIAHGVPIGAGLEMTDQFTLKEAFEGRKPISN
ncbi:MAG: recombination mediator RecR [Candidatus Hydrogenedentes bacterium]|nr:recombination mediator RecR [Candidatus Hydrogenedentota bacterium]